MSKTPQYPIPHNNFPNDPELTELYNRWLAIRPPAKREICRQKIRAAIKQLQETE